MVLEHGSLGGDRGLSAAVLNQLARTYLNHGHRGATVVWVWSSSANGKGQCEQPPVESGWKGSQSVLLLPPVCRLAL